MKTNPARVLLAVTVAALLGLSASVAGAQSTIRIAQTLSHNSLNPGEASGLSDATVVRTMYEGLVGFDPDGKLVPELATSWTAGDDATSFTFELRQGVTFHDGTAFDAQAVKDYYDWVLNPDSKAARGRSTLSAIQNIEVLGQYEVRIDLDAPNGAFIYVLATSNARIASPASIDEYGADVGKHPVGTGPFRFVSWSEGENIVVEKNPDYWGEPAKVDRLEFLIVNNAATRVAMLQSGEAQFIEDLPPQLIDSVKSAPNLEVVPTKTNFLRILELNTTKKPFDDVRVRQAMNYAIDKDQLVKVVFNGYATVMTAPIPATAFGYAEQPAYSYDPEKAKQLLADAGYADGFSFTVLTFTGDEYRTAGQVLQQMFSQVGLKMTLDQKERGALVDQIFKPVDENPTEAALVGASASTGDADLALTFSFAKQSFPPAANDWSFYTDDRVETLLQQGRATGDPQARSTAYAEAESIIWQAAPWVFLYSPDAIGGRSADVTGVQYAPDKTVDARYAALK